MDCQNIGFRYAKSSSSFYATRPRNCQCFGSNEYGELGIGSTNNVGDEPYHMGVNLTVVDLGANASAVSAGEHITCARLSDDGVKCW